MTADQLCAAMEEHRLTVLYSHPNEAGTKVVRIPCGQLEEFLADPVTWLAARYRVNREQYLTWHESGYTVRCSGSTSHGKPCRNVVEGGHSIGHTDPAWEKRS
jgi:hypothetical protein